MGKKWNVIVDKKVASKQIPQLPKKIQLLVNEAINDLENEGPRPHGWDVKS
jgi:mRNA-degrading endonuclease RelE of RelBE toxin-antitoxin system